MRVQPFNDPLPHQRRKRFFAWQVEITTRCPLSCRMCIRQGLPGWIEADMSLADFRRLVPYFDDVGTIILQGWGEPLLNNDLVPIIRAAKQGTGDSAGYRPPDVGFVTSGKGLDAHTSAALIDAGLDFIGFSLAGSSAAVHETIRMKSDFSALVNAIHTFSELQANKGATQPRSHIVYLMLRDNMRDLPLLPRLARDVGVRSIVLTNLIHVATGWQDAQRVYSCGGHNEYEEVLKETAIRARELGVHLRYPGLIARERPVCEEDPLRNLYISVSGEISPCVYLNPPASSPFKRIFCGRESAIEKVTFGNVLQESFGRVWEVDAYENFRERMRRRDTRSGTISSFLFAISGVRRKPDTRSLPDPPAPCRTCHKMLGV